MSESIDTQEFRAAMRSYAHAWSTDREDMHAFYLAVLEIIDAKLAQAFNDGAIEGRIHQRGIDAARIDAAESRLAEIQRGVEGLDRYDQGWDGIMLDPDGGFIGRDGVLALFAPQGQASDTVEMKG